MTGLVTLLGAGPGDLELVTLKGVRSLQEADVVVYDRLINQELFQYLRKDCEQIDVGKKPGMPCISQKEIEKILIEKAQEGKRVVRLKSGDPYVFGRGGEEGVSLAQAGVPFQVVPGISSSVAALTYAGIPATYRELARSFHVFTAHLKDEAESLNWDVIAQLDGTLIFLMGMKHLPSIVEELVSRAYPTETPAAVIEWGTHPQQRSVVGNLQTIVSLATEQEFQAPSVIVIGEVVSFRNELNFYEMAPLFGHKVLIQHSATGKLPRLLKDDGAHVVTFPAREQIEKVVFSFPNLDTVDGILVTDTQSWSIFLEELLQQGRDVRSLGQVKFAALGHHTAKTVEHSGIRLDKVGFQLSDAVFAADLKAEGESWLILTADYKKAILESLYTYPLVVTHRVAFQREISTKDWDSVEAICLPNSVAAMNFVAASKETGYNWGNRPIIVMGDSTRAVLEEAGFSSIVETDALTIASIRDKCRELFG